MLKELNICDSQKTIILKDIEKEDCYVVHTIKGIYNLPKQSHTKHKKTIFTLYKMLK